MSRRCLRPVDLQLLSSALSGDVVSSPEQGCEAFGVQWPTGLDDARDRIRAEAGALERLYRLLVQQLHDLAPGLPADRVFSTGSLVTWGLERGKVRPLADKTAGIDPFFLAEMASAFYGGRIEALMPGIATFMALADISKTYPSILSLGDLGRFYGADEFGIEVANPAEVRRLLRSCTWWQDPEAWKHLSTLFVTVRVMAGLIAPSHPEWAPGVDGLTVAPLDLLGGTRTFHAYDLAAAVEEGSDPDSIEMVGGWHLTALGRQRGLRTMRLLSGRGVDLHTDDLGTALIEDCEWAEHQRDRPWLGGLTKRYAQVAAFGGLARHDRRSLDEPTEHHAHGPGGVLLSRRTQHPEIPGPYAFLPLAAAVCAGARLALAMAQRQVRDA
jgi:hypothetical protein